MNSREKFWEERGTKSSIREFGHPVTSAEYGKGRKQFRVAGRNHLPTHERSLRKGKGWTVGRDVESWRVRKGKFNNRSGKKGSSGGRKKGSKGRETDQIRNYLAKVTNVGTALLTKGGGGMCG